MGEFNFEKVVCDEKDEGQRIEISVTATPLDVDRVIAEFYRVMARVKGIKSEDTSEIRVKLVELLNEEDVDDACRDYVLNRFTTAVVRQVDFDTVLSPGVHAEYYPRQGECFSFDINVILRPQLSLSSVDPVVVTHAPIEISEEDIEEQIAFTARQFSEYSRIERAILQPGDFALVDIDMVRNGKVDKELSGIGRLIEVQHGLLPDALIDGMAGMKSGEIRKITFTLPKDQRGFSDDGNNETDSYCADVMLKELQEKVVPTIDDAWVVENLPQFEDMAGFRAYIKADFEQQRGRVEQQDLIYRVRSELEKRLEGVIPDEMYQEAKDSLMMTVIKKIENQGQTLDEYFEEHDMTNDVFNMNIFMQASEYLRQNLALDVLANERGLVETEDDIWQAKEKLGPEMAMLSKEEFEKRGLKKPLSEQIRREKAMSWLLDTAVVVGI